MKKILSILLVLGLIISKLPSSTVSAKTNYKYTVTVYAGNQGSFSGGQKEVSVEVEAGSQVTISMADLGFKVENEKYYARGFREAGHDNDETTGAVSLSFKVNEDMSYVVAYGVRGEMVKYTVQYVDANGNELLPADEFYGMEGDKPVVAHRYIEGYQPQAYNVTKTLSANEADNVFVFTYTEAEVTVVPQTVPAGAGGTINVTPATPGGEGEGTTPGGEGEGTTPGGEGGEGTTPGGEGGEGTTPGGDGDNPQPTPPGPEDIDDQDTPLAPGGNSWLVYAAGGVAGVGLIAFLLALLKKKREEEEEKA